MFINSDCQECIWNNSCPIYTQVLENYDCDYLLDFEIDDDGEWMGVSYRRYVQSSWDYEEE